MGRFRGFEAKWLPLGSRHGVPPLRSGPVPLGFLVDIVAGPPLTCSAMTAPRPWPNMALCCFARLEHLIPCMVKTSARPSRELCRRSAF